jgi:hypothetical protein
MKESWIVHHGLVVFPMFHTNVWELVDNGFKYFIGHWFTQRKGLAGIIRMYKELVEYFYL